MLNVLIVTYHPIYPLKTGASVAQFGMIEALSKLCNLSVAIPENHYPNEVDFSELVCKIPRAKIYCLPNRSKKDTALLGLTVESVKDKIRLLVKCFVILMNKISFPPGDSTHSKSVVSATELFCQMYQISPFLLLQDEICIDVIQGIIDSDKIDIVQVEFAENANLVATLPAKVRKIFVNHECYGDRLKSHVSTLPVESKFLEYFCDVNQLVEASILSQYDAVVSFSCQDNENVKKMVSSYTEKPFCLVAPYAIPDSEFRDVNPEISDIKKIIFVGPESHFPNKDAAEWFIENVATEVLQKIGLRFCIIGEWKQETISKYINHPSQVEFLGYVDDLYCHSHDAISISPVRIGSGLRTKTMVAMAQGIPVVATRFSLAGLEATHLKNVLIAESPSEFLWCIQRLVDDKKHNHEIRINAQILIRENYSQHTLAENRMQLYNDLMTEISRTR
jgi:glycosyltransferase involved in cell wall biosynthesis